PESTTSRPAGPSRPPGTDAARDRTASAREPPGPGTRTRERCQAPTSPGENAGTPARPPGESRGGGRCSCERWAPGRRRAPPGAWMKANGSRHSPQSDARVDQAVHQVGQEITNKHGQGNDKKGRLNHRIILLQGSVDQVPPDSVQRKDGLGDHCARNQARKRE